MKIASHIFTGKAAQARDRIGWSWFPYRQGSKLGSLLQNLGETAAKRGTCLVRTVDNFCGLSWFGPGLAGFHSREGLTFLA